MKAQYPQVGETVEYPLGQRCQAVAEEIQPPEPGQAIEQAVGQGGQLVAGEVQPLQVGQPVETVATQPRKSIAAEEQPFQRGQAIEQSLIQFGEPVVAHEQRYEVGQAIERARRQRCQFVVVDPQLLQAREAVEQAVRQRRQLVARELQLSQVRQTGKIPRLQCADTAVPEFQDLYRGQVLVCDVSATRVGEFFEDLVADLGRAIADAGSGRRIGCQSYATEERAADPQEGEFPNVHPLVSAFPGQDASDRRIFGNESWKLSQPIKYLIEYFLRKRSLKIAYRIHAGRLRTMAYTTIPMGPSRPAIKESTTVVSARMPHTAPAVPG